MPKGKLLETVISLIIGTRRGETLHSFIKHLIFRRIPYRI